MKIASYSVADLIGYMKAGVLKIKDISMLRNLSLFSADELMEFISSGACTFEDMQRCGLHYQRQNELRERLQLWQIEQSFWQSAMATNTPASYREYLTAFPNGVMAAEAQRRLVDSEEDEIWNTALERNQKSYYEVYLNKYPKGRFAMDAEARIHEINQVQDQLKEDLFYDMRLNPWKYTPYKMQLLLQGSHQQGATPADAGNSYGDVADRFIANRMTVDYRELVDAGIVPPQITERDLITPESQLPQFNSYDAYPEDRTDIYFLGVPRSGKSSVLAGLFHAMNAHGSWYYEPNLDANGQDPSMAYYNGLLRCVGNKKPPVPTARETINYININVPNVNGSRHMAELNFVEISGESFNSLADLYNAREEWERLGASKVLANQSRKVLFFLLDYNTILGNQDGISLQDQQQALSNALTIFSHDGTGRDHSKGCTLSKVESVVIIMTKADLMGTDDRHERVDIARRYLQENFQSFMKNLERLCGEFGINKADGYRPMIMTFSLGNFYVGNTLIFNPQDSLALAQVIESLVPKVKRSGFFG